MASATEAELGVLFENCQKVTSIRTPLEEMSHQQPPTLDVMYNTAANSIANGTAKQKISGAIDTIFIGSEKEYTKPFPHILGEGREKPSGLCYKTTLNLIP